MTIITIITMVLLLSIVSTIITTKTTITTMPIIRFFSVEDEAQASGRNCRIVACRFRGSGRIAWGFLLARYYPLTWGGSGGFSKYTYNAFKPYNNPSYPHH